MLRAPRAPPGSFPFPDRHSPSSRVKQHSLILLGWGKSERGFQCLVKPQRGAQNTRSPRASQIGGEIRGLRFRTERLSEPEHPPCGTGCPGCASPDRAPGPRPSPGRPQPLPVVRFRSVTRSRRGRSGHCGPTARTGVPRKPLGTAGWQHLFTLRQEPGRGRSSPVSPPRGHPPTPHPRSRALPPPSREEQGLGAARTARPEGRNLSGRLCSCTPNSLPSFLPVSRGSSPIPLLLGARRLFQTFPTAAPERPRPRGSRRRLSPPERPRPGPYLK